MTTTINRQAAPAQFDRGTSDADVPPERHSLRTLTLVLLGVASLLVLTVVLAIVGISYRPYRGC